ncbi:MAG: hypothetical protein K1X67_13140 [Fimbriimonadaceae bacterium]|nr:hypothetical protein [Fimbriimonadaceae bacterium]
MTAETPATIVEEFLALGCVQAKGVQWTESLADMLSETESALMMVDLRSVDECSRQLPALLCVVALFASMPEAGECVRISIDYLDRLLLGLDESYSGTVKFLPKDVLMFFRSFLIYIEHFINDPAELGLMANTLEVLESELNARSNE